MHMTSGTKEKPTIVFVIRYFHPFIGGLEKKTLNLASALIERGMRIEIITSRFYPAWPEKDLVKNVPAYRLPSPRIKVLGAFVFLVALCWYLYKQRTRIKIIHTFQVGYSSAAAIVMGKLLSKPTILNLSGSGIDGDIMRHKRTPWGRLFLFFCRSASRIVILNTEMYQELKSIAYVDTSIVKIPNGVDLATYRGTDNKQLWKKKIGIDTEKVILYTGRLAAEKGVAFLIRAYAALSLPQPTKLYILGAGPQLSALQKFLRQHNLLSTVTILPPVEDILPFLYGADIFVMPSRSEGLSNSILEAMACGLPVIATRVEGNTDLIEDGVNGLLVAPDDEGNLVNALTQLLTRPEKAAALGQRARQMVCEKYDLQSMVGQYSALYSSLSSP
ncbi:MAG: glycosyltransferase family 4 protein [Proteobacteria bacterium]|nr:glycosyltransferase family 4 protein [Pseudomonadota bacterium]